MEQIPDAPWIRNPGEYTEDDREILGCCEECGEPIREGDTFYVLLGCHFCEDCIENARRYS